ncbi:hypothetical protein [Streptomyces sp. NPDC048527]
MEIQGTHVGKAYTPADLTQLCRRAGLDDLDLGTGGAVQWIGGASDMWQ